MGFRVLIPEAERLWVMDVLPRVGPGAQFVLLRRFGLETGVPETYQHIADEYGVTRERIRQIEARGLSRLKGIARKERRSLWDWLDATEKGWAEVYAKRRR